MLSLNVATQSASTTTLYKYRNGIIRVDKSTAKFTKNAETGVCNLI